MGEIRVEVIASPLYALHEQTDDTRPLQNHNQRCLISRPGSINIFLWLNSVFFLFLTISGSLCVIRYDSNRCSIYMCYMLLKQLSCRVLRFIDVNMRDLGWSSNPITPHPPQSKNPPKKSKQQWRPHKRLCLRYFPIFKNEIWSRLVVHVVLYHISFTKIWYNKKSC